MQYIYEKLYHQIKKVLEKNIDAQTRYLKSAENSQHEDVKLFFKQKAHNSELFNERLIFELNYSFDAPNIEGDVTDSLHDKYMEVKDVFLATRDESLLMESLKEDKVALKDYEELLKHTNLPLSIRFILKEQVTIVKLNRLKTEQLINYI